MEEIEELINKAYAIKCIHICDDCKKGLEYCPKAYADDLKEALKIINENKPVLERYLKECD